MSITFGRLIAVAGAGLLAPCAVFAIGTTLTGTIRDFNSDGVNFEGELIGSVPSLVETTLTGPSPTLISLGRSVIEPNNFALWFTKPTDSVSYSIGLSETTPGSGVFAYSNSNFFPIDGQLLGNQGRSHNYRFTYTISGIFEYIPGSGQTFSFAGDDDVWAFFDKAWH